MSQPLHAGDIVKYRQPLPDEEGITFKVMEIRPDQNWVLMAAQIGLNINPTETANISDIEKI